MHLSLLQSNEELHVGSTNGGTYTCKEQRCSDSTRIITPTPLPRPHVRSDIVKLIPTHNHISSISSFCFVEHQFNQCLFLLAQLTDNCSDHSSPLYTAGKTCEWPGIPQCCGLGTGARCMRNLKLKVFYCSTMICRIIIQMCRSFPHG